MKLLRWTVRLHKWIALIIGIQILLWIAGGVVMSVIPIEIVRGEHKIAEQADRQLPAGNLIPLDTASQAAGLSDLNNAQSGWVLDRPVWRLRDSAGRTATVDALSGERLDPIDEALALQIARADYLGAAEIEQAALLETSPPEYGGAAPVWRVRFADRDATTLYIDPALAEVRARRSQTWRFYDFFWKLHVMDYDDGADFNNPLLITSAGVALIVALSGLTLLFFRMRRTLIAWYRRRRRLNP